jgi:hypothetical protein
MEEWSQFKKGVNSAAIYLSLWLFSNFLDKENRVRGQNVWVLSVALPLALFLSLQASTRFSGIVC